MKYRNYLATQGRKLATHKCVATPWLRTTALDYYITRILANATLQVQKLSQLLELYKSQLYHSVNFIPFTKWSVLDNSRKATKLCIAIPTPSISVASPWKHIKDVFLHRLTCKWTTTNL